MINMERTSARKGVAAEEEPQREQPVEAISSAFRQAFPEPRVQNFIRCFAQHEEYYQVASRY